MKCCYCHRDLPIEAFPLKYGHVRYKSCRECYALGHSCLRPEPKPKRPKLSPEEKKAHRKAYMLEYQRKYRAANREKVRTKQDFTVRPVPTKEPVKAGRLCQQCVNWPCFAGIENLETDFAKEGCHGWFPMAEVS